jgi:hypothetical protein
VHDRRSLLQAAYDYHLFGGALATGTLLAVGFITGDEFD